MQPSILFMTSILAVFVQAAPQASPASERSAEIHIFDQESCTRAETTGRIDVFANDLSMCTKLPSDKPVKSVWTKYLGKGCMRMRFRLPLCLIDNG